jgi:hypothetical protein
MRRDRCEAPSLATPRARPAASWARSVARDCRDRFCLLVFAPGEERPLPCWAFAVALVLFRPGRLELPLLVCGPGCLLTCFLPSKTSLRNAHRVHCNRRASPNVPPGGWRALPRAALIAGEGCASLGSPSPTWECRTRQHVRRSGNMSASLAAGSDGRPRECLHAAKGFHSHPRRSGWASPLAFGYPPEGNSRVSCFTVICSVTVPSSPVQTTNASTRATATAVRRMARGRLIVSTPA